jgi:hypothetical protein
MANTCLNLPGKDSSYSTWIEWHKALKGCVGKKNANQLWLMQYDKVAPGDSVEVRSYMKTQGVDLDRDILERLTDFGGGVYNWVGGTLDFSSGIAMIVVVMIVGGAGMMLFNIVKTPEGSKRLAAGIATRGMSETGRVGGGGTKQITG